MIAAVGARNLSKFDAGVVHALMQARYQNSSRGQFISEDPVFLGSGMVPEWCFRSKCRMENFVRVHCEK
jgi:hypothetical protein